MLPSILFISPNNTPQSIGSTITYAKRYSLASILGVAGKEEDDDGNNASNSHQQQQTIQQPSVINKKQVQELREIAEKAAEIGGIDVSQVLKVIGVPLAEIQQHNFEEAKKSFSIILKRAEDKKKKDAEQEQKQQKEETSKETPKQEAKKTQTNEGAKEVADEKNDNESEVTLVIKSVQDGITPNKTPFKKVITEDGRMFMAKDETVVESFGEVQEGNKVNVLIYKENDFTFISKVNSIEKVS